MDSILLFLSFLCMIVGLLGSFLPVLPGPPISWLGLVLLYLTEAIPTSYLLLGITGVVALVVAILDYVIPAQGTKRFGGTTYGIWGTNIGLLIGLIAPIPFGFIVGPFLGALIGELIAEANNPQKALKAATGSFMGFLASTFMKFVVAIIFFGIYIAKVWEFRQVLF
jgi:uncharacterized protein